MAYSQLGARSALIVVLCLGALTGALALGLALWGDLDAFVPMLFVIGAPMSVFVLAALLVRMRMTARMNAAHTR